MPRLPVTIFTGFLGSGKTTLLSSLLAAERQQRFAIVVNEFGAVSVDDVLLQHAVDGRYAKVFNITTGLIAYAGDEFRSIMQAISAEARFFDHVLIETSGLAVPTAVLEALQTSPLQEHFLHDATLTIVDTPVLLSGAYNAEAQPASTGAAMTAVFQQQLLCADVVVLNKIEPCTADDLLRAETAIRTRAPDVRFVELAWNAQLDARLVLGLHLNEFRAYVPGVGVAGSGGGSMSGVEHVHSGLGAHEHGLLTHEHLHEEDPGWLSFVLRTEAPQDPTLLHTALSAITAHAPVLRVKGFAHVRDATGHLLVQGVRTRITCTMEPTTLPAEHHAHETLHTHHHPALPAHVHQAMAELVFIGYHLERQHIVAELCAHTGTTWY